MESRTWTSVLIDYCKAQGESPEIPAVDKYVLHSLVGGIRTSHHLVV